MSWYTAPAGRAFTTQFAPDWPRRGSKDGSVGDTAHNARVSDHNPDYKNGGVVRAVDVDIKGRDKAAMIAAALSDERTRYLISDGRIWQNPAVYPRAGGWQTYRGSDGHYGHVHLSIRHAKKYENDTRPWGKAPTPTPPEQEDDDMTPDEREALFQVRDVLGARGGLNTPTQNTVAYIVRNLPVPPTAAQNAAAVWNTPIDRGTHKVSSLQELANVRSAQLNQPPVEVHIDNAALAAELAPLLAANTRTLSDEDIKELSQALADEQGRRLSNNA